MKTKRLYITVPCTCVYNSSIDVPYEMSFDEAVEYANEHINEINVDELTWIEDQEITEYDCTFEQE